MGGYDERELDITTRPLTKFETPLAILKLTRLTQGGSNSVAVYQAPMTWILKEEIPEHPGIFIDDGGIKGPRSTYQHKTLKQNLLTRTLDIVRHVVSLGGRKISKRKINKIQNGPRTTTKKEVRGFLGLCAYVRIFVKDLSQVSTPFRRLTREDVLWKWDEKFEEDFIKLRKIVGEEITLKTLNYDKESGKIKLAKYSSRNAAGAVLMQEDYDGKDRPVLYETVTFSRLESKYSQPKLEL
ncbi:hypothetical protein O181_097206 [Austropuccinia psidii MF-1]|uniref:Reverse transcriptase/retrotransposon-derived protein RNase H-like domain-containing protein n=1 Tax=Austropuccinia psidii MF-1 TaxID=1389203 RepID=A0A9Q3J8X9_9BASI|nr:hypothetical protein [Austropuccinia psidii MF-1]